MADRSIKVTLRADASDFKQQFDAASKAAEQVAKSTEQAGSKSQSAFGKVKQSAQDNREAWTTAGTALTGFGAAILGAGAMAAKTGVAYNQLQQRAGSALEVLMGSAEAAAAQMEKLNSFADTSPFSREIFIEAQQQLIAFGVEAERVVPILSAVQDAVAATGGSNADIAELVNIIAKVGSTGKITAQTLNELGYRGVDAATIIGEQMGKTGQQIRDEITAGTLDADAAMQALTDGMSERFGGAAAGMKETFDGAIDRLKAAWRDLSAELMTPLVSPDGGGFLVDLTNRAADALRLFQALPGPVKGAAGALAGLTGAASLGAGAFLLLLPRTLDTIRAFNTLRRDMPGTVGALKSLGKTAGVTAAALVGLGLAASAWESHRDAAADVDEFESSLRNLALTGSITTEAVNDLASSTVPFGVSVRGVGDALDLIDPDPVSSALEGLTNIILGVPTTADVAAESLGSLDSALSSLARDGAFDELGAAFNAALADAEEYGHTASDLLERLPGLSAVFTDMATSMELQADEATLLKLITGELVPVFDDATGAVIGYAEGAEGAAEATQSVADTASEALSAIQALADEFISAERGMLDYADAMDRASEAASENAGHWEDGTQAARDNKNELLGLAEQALKTADALSAKGKSGTFLEGAREDLIAVATEMTGSREEAEKYVDQLLGTPDEIETIVKLEAEEAQAKWDAIYAELWPEGGHPPMLLEADTDPAEQEILNFVGMEPPPVGVDVEADTGFAEDQLAKFEEAVNGTGGVVTINGTTLPAETALLYLESVIDNSDGTVTINGVTVSAEEALGQLIGAVNASSGVVTIEGNNSPANEATDEAKRHADGTTGTINVDADTGSAESGINRTARDRSSTITANAATWSAENQLNWLARNRSSTITVRTQGAGGGVQAQLAYASGGPVYGPGTGTSDSIPAMLSNNEHVLTAREVAVAGGHHAIYSLRQQLLAGAKTLHLATGGGVENGQIAPVRYAPVSPQAGRPVSASVDTGAIASAVATAMAGWKPMVSIGDREFVGVMRRAERMSAR